MSELQASKRPRGRPKTVTDSAKKEKKKILDLKHNKARVNLGGEIDRWNMLKETLGLKSNPDVAKVLLDSVEDVQQKCKKPPPAAATLVPDVKPRLSLLETLPDASESSSGVSVHRYDVKQENLCLDAKMDIHGQFSSSFVITDQPFDEQFRVILETTVSVFDKFGNLASIVKADICSKSFVIDKSIRSKCQQELDVRQLFAHQMKKEETTNSPKVILILDLDTFSLKTRCSDQKELLIAKKPTLDSADNRVYKHERSRHGFLQGTNVNLLDENNTKSTPLFQAPRLFQATDDSLHKTKKHESVLMQLSEKCKCLQKSVGYLKNKKISLSEAISTNCDLEAKELNGKLDVHREVSGAEVNDQLISSEHEKEKRTENISDCDSTEDSVDYNESVSGDCDNEEETNDEIKSHPIESPVSTFVNCQNISTSACKNDMVDKLIPDTEHDNDDPAEHHVTKISRKTSAVNKNVCKETDSDMLGNSYEVEATELSQENSCATLVSERRYPKRSRKKLSGLENFYINDEISEHETLSTDGDEENNDKIERRKSLKRKRKTGDSDSDDDYVPSDMDEIPSDVEEILENLDEEGHLDSGENNETENETVSDQQKKAAKINSQIEKFKNILIEKGLETKIPAETVDHRLLLAKLRVEVNLAERIKVDLREIADKFEMKTFTSFEQKNRRVQTPEKSLQLFSCKICNQYQTKTGEMIRFHIEQHVNRELQCKWCKMEFSRVHDKSMHQRDAHLKKGNPKIEIKQAKICELCGYKGVLNVTWKKHMFVKHGIPSFQCKFCHEMFSTNEDLNTHLRQTHPADIISCDKCGKAFQEITGLTSHSMRCSFEMPLVDSKTCHLCGETLASFARLKQHIGRVHNHEKYFHCDLCSYSCETNSRLKRHMDAHLGNKKYRCDICGVTMVQKYQLTTHMRIHNNDKPYKCDQCTYASAWNVQLKSHQKVHALENTLTCDECGVVLKDKKALLRHQKRDHEENCNDNSEKD